MNISLRSDDTKIEINNKEKVLIFSYEDSYNNDDDNLIKKESEKKNPLSDNNIISTDGSYLFYIKEFKIITLKVIKN